MGGSAGRVGALFGAVGCQGISGALRCHYLLCVQRVHQMHRLKGFAKLSRQKVFNVDTTKRLPSNLCPEDFQDICFSCRSIGAAEQA